VSVEGLGAGGRKTTRNKQAFAWHVLPVPNVNLPDKDRNAIVLSEKFTHDSRSFPNALRLWVLHALFWDRGKVQYVIRQVFTYIDPVPTSARNCAGTASVVSRRQTLQT
jgi:hypothetical protein